MKKNILMCCICWALFAQPGNAQTQPKTGEDTTKVNELLAKSKEAMGSAPDLAINYSQQAKEVAERISFTQGKALALKNIGIVYFMQGKHKDALDYWTQSYEVFKSVNDQIGVSNILNNIGTIHSIQGDYQKALEKYLESLKFAEQSGDKARMVSTLNNVGATYALKPETYDKALQFYLKALSISEQSMDMNGIGTTAVNIGEVYSNKGDRAQALFYFNMSLKAYSDSKDEMSIPYTYNALAKEYKKKGDYAMALNFHKKAYATATKTENKLYVVHSLLGMANTHAAAENLAAALTHYKQAENLSRQINALDELKDIYNGLSATYAGLEQYANAFKYQTLFTNVKDTLYNIATNKKLASMQYDFDLQKKQGQINQLTTEKSLRDAEIKRQRLARLALTIGLALVLIIAIIIFRNYRIKVKTNKILDSQKAEIEGLLLNILPAQVAQELKATGHATPRNYDSVSVLFTDFKGFTTIADKMHPQDLVEELDTCFGAFDNIVEKYGLEKIKTIGDAYMCAGGIPTPDKDHVHKTVKASLEMQDYIINMNRRRRAEGKEVWDLRVGIHVGPIVAGVVGKKKYAYDIWGSTVNIASRMESSGAPGKVNISASTYQLIKDQFICSYRGKVYAKNVGEIDMYFIDQEILPTYPVKQGTAAAELLAANA